MILTGAVRRWRVRVHAVGGEPITHESFFAGEKAARDYYDALAIPGSVKRIERRRGSRYELVRTESMEPELVNPG